MKKQLRPLLPVFVIVGVLLILAVVRAYSLGKFSEDGRWEDIQGGTYSTPVMRDGVNYLVPPDELYENGLGKDGMPPLNAPSFVSMATADDVLDDTVSGISVVVDGRARFYSFQILNWHEAVNDRFGSKDLLISYSTLCGSAVVYDRAVEGKVRTFGDDGLVYNNCAVFYDSATDTKWNQATGEAIAGDEIGKFLTRYPSEVMTWAEWKAAYPTGEALSTETGFVREYRRHPYGGYESSTTLFFPVNATQNRVPSKTVVKDYVVNNQHVGLTLPLAAFLQSLNVTVPGLLDVAPKETNFAIFTDGAHVHLFETNVDGRELTFKKEGNVITDEETKSTWSADGSAKDGELKGKKLTELSPDAQYFMFAYVSEYPMAIIPGAKEKDAAVANTPKAPEGETVHVE
jgi:hypothetical protein